MRNKTLEKIIVRMENYVECWKQFSHFMNLARFKKFSLDDENQFLEIKSVLTQELELLLSAVDCGQITREEVHSLNSSAPSIRYLSETNEAGLRTTENQWHKLFICLQSILGQLKVKQKQFEGQSFWGSFLGGKK